MTASTERPTPETDAFYRHRENLERVARIEVGTIAVKWGECGKHARRLERQRDALAEALRKLREETTQARRSPPMRDYPQLHEGVDYVMRLAEKTPGSTRTTFNERILRTQLFNGQVAAMLLDRLCAALAALERGDDAIRAAKEGS